MRKKLLVSFSGGRTSAFMCKYLLDNKQDEYEMLFVFANTGKEREETLEFVEQCDKEFGLNLIWVEAIINMERGVGTTHKIVDFKSANRKGEPFEEAIKKFGIPNSNNPYCSAYLKKYPIRSYAKSLGWKKYYTALGIRSDEKQRINRKTSIKEKLIYFADFTNVTKSDINLFWSKQNFDLKLKSFEGNCDLCYKKSMRTLMHVTKEKPELADWWREMEQKYSNWLPIERQKQFDKLPFTFYRGDLYIDEIIEESKFPFDSPVDTSKEYDKFKQMMLWDGYLDSNGGCTESCEVF